MSDRRLRVLVAVAVVAGAAVAGVLFATQGSTKPARVLQIDEVGGRVGQVVLGETLENVVGVLGKPSLGKDLGRYYVPRLLVYPHLQIRLRNDHVVSIRTDDPAAQTEKVIKIGDLLSAARASYRKAAKCNPNSPDKTAKHPHCTVKVPAGVLEIAGDPITRMTLSRTG